MITDQLKQILAEGLGLDQGTIQFHHVTGGSINESYRLQSKQLRLFCKVNCRASYPDMFEKERRGLNLLHQIGGMHTARPVGVFYTDEAQCLVLEWIESAHPSTNFWDQFGEALAAMHNQASSDLFGLDESNYMGSMVQSNVPLSRWADFFSTQRLLPQAAIAQSQGLLASADISSLERLCSKLDSVFPDEAPVLVHGDLWSGNFLCSDHHQPVLIDPAVYYGSRHVDLALTTLFGGFDQRFYDAYRHHAPFPNDVGLIWDIANLYPLLMHLNLFGGSYKAAVQAVLKQF